LLFDLITNSPDYAFTSANAASNALLAPIIVSIAHHLHNSTPGSAFPASGCLPHQAGETIGMMGVTFDLKTRASSHCVPEGNEQLAQNRDWIGLSLRRQHLDDLSGQPIKRFI
jgi:hypothetical protein